jgi:hypothetical protein
VCSSDLEERTLAGFQLGALIADWWRDWCLAQAEIARTARAGLIRS